MNDILFWCKDLLVPFIFHDVTSLHPPSFHRNDFPLVPLIFHFGAKPQQKCDVSFPSRALVQFIAHTHTLTTPPLFVHVHVNSVVPGLLAWRPTIYRRDARPE